MHTHTKRWEVVYIVFNNIQRPGAGTMCGLHFINYTIFFPSFCLRTPFAFYVLVELSAGSMFINQKAKQQLLKLNGRKSILFI